MEESIITEFEYYYHQLIYFPSIQLEEKDIEEKELLFYEIEERRVNKELVHKECSICLEKFKIPQKVKVLNCGHIFHFKCLYNWFVLKTSCPNCRFKVS